MRKFLRVGIQVPNMSWLQISSWVLLSEARCIYFSLFRKYLDKAGVLELLTKSLVQLYEVCLSTYLYFIITFFIIDLILIPLFFYFILEIQGALRPSF